MPRGIKNKNKYRISICKHTKKKILQLHTENGWLCLHNNDPELDKIDVENFAMGYRFRK